MKSRKRRDPSDDEPTAEHQALKDVEGEIDPADTDKFRVSLDVTGEHSSGSVDHDDRGQARWKWNTETTQSSDTDRTFDLLKALTNEALSIETTASGTPKPARKSGYDPYDVGGGGEPKAKARKKSRG